MSNLNPLSASPSLLDFLKQHRTTPEIWLADGDYDLDEATAALAPEAAKRCQVSPFFIQAISAGQTQFLVTNLPRCQVAEVTSIAPCWLIGRSSTCSIIVPDASVSRCHAVLGFHAADGFYLSDVGSSNGTWVGGELLMPNQRHSLQDGALLRFGRLQVEFFLAACGQCLGRGEDTAEYSEG